MANDISVERMQCQHVSKDAPDINPRRYSVSVANDARLDFAVLDVCRECDLIFNVGGSVILSSGRRIKLPDRNTPIVREVSTEMP